MCTAPTLSRLGSPIHECITNERLPRPSCLESVVYAWRQLDRVIVLLKVLLHGCRSEAYVQPGCLSLSTVLVHPFPAQPRISGVVGLRQNSIVQSHVNFCPLGHVADVRPSVMILDDDSTGTKRFYKETHLGTHVRFVVEEVELYRLVNACLKMSWRELRGPTLDWACPNLEG